MEGELKLSVTQISLEDNKTVQLAADGVSRKRYFFTRGEYVGGWARWELLLTKIKALLYSRVAKRRREKETKRATDGKDSTWNWNQQFEIWNWAYYLMVNLTYSLQSTRNSIEITWKYNCEKNLYLNLTFLVAVSMWPFAWNTRIKCRPLVGYLIVSFCLFVCNSTCLSICPSALVLAWFSSSLAVCLSVCPSVFVF